MSNYPVNELTRYRQRSSSMAIRSNQGLTLIELLIAMTIGLFLMAGLTTMYSASINSYVQMQKVIERNENGRYALKELSDDIHHAGYYGHYYEPPVSSTLPDPCATDLSDLTDGLSFPLQGYSNVTSSPITCLSTSDIVSGSDILVVRRSDTSPLEGSDTPSLNDVYIQANHVNAQLQLGNPSGFSLGSLNTDNSISNVGTTADGSSATILMKANVTGASPTNSDLRLAANISKYHVHIYFLAPCHKPASRATSCTGVNDDGGSPIPTLKRLELTAEDGVTTFRTVPLVEGVEEFQIDFGVDSSVENEVGWGSANNYIASPTAEQHSNIMSLKVYLLTRNTEKTAGYQDKKIYVLGTKGNVNPSEKEYKRRLYSSVVRVNNLSSRREIPL